MDLALCGRQVERRDFRRKTTMKTHKVTTVHGETFVLIADKVVYWEIRHTTIIVHFVNGDSVSLHKTEEDSFLQWIARHGALKAMPLLGAEIC